MVDKQVVITEKPSKSLLPSKEEQVISAPVLETSTESSEEEPKTLPKIRLRVEEEAGKVKQFATAQGLSMHRKVVKAKRFGLTTLHTIATWLTPKKPD